MRRNFIPIPPYLEFSLIFHRKSTSLIDLNRRGKDFFMFLGFFLFGKLFCFVLDEPNFIPISPSPQFRFFLSFSKKIICCYPSASVAFEFPAPASPSSFQSEEFLFPHGFPSRSQCVTRLCSVLPRLSAFSSLS